MRSLWVVLTADLGMGMRRYVLELLYSTGIKL